MSLNFSENSSQTIKVLKQGLEEPLNGMKEDLAPHYLIRGSLILALDLQSNQQQTDFIMRLLRKSYLRKLNSLMERRRQ